MVDGMDPELATSAEDARAWRAVADSLGALTAAMREQEPQKGLEELIRQGGHELVGARWASITLLRRGRFLTIASTATVADGIDRLQYDFGSGPCVDAVLDDTVYLTPDVRAEDKWRPLGTRLNDTFGVRSMLAYRLHLLDRCEAIAGLNFSSDRSDAFSPADVQRGKVLAAHCALLVSAVLAQDKASNLLKAMQSNREIGVAVGILMAHHHISRDQAFDLLRLASQHTNRKLADIASDVADTGADPFQVSTATPPPA
jgi:ANTAR domain